MSPPANLIVSLLWMGGKSSRTSKLGLLENEGHQLICYDFTSCKGRPLASSPTAALCFCSPWCPDKQLLHVFCEGLVFIDPKLNQVFPWTSKHLCSICDVSRKFLKSSLNRKYRLHVGWAVAVDWLGMLAAQTGKTENHQGLTMIIHLKPTYVAFDNSWLLWWLWVVVCQAWKFNIYRTQRIKKTVTFFPSDTYVVWGLMSI